METYSYEAAAGDGNIVTGNVEAASERAAVDRIQGMGYFPLKVSKAVEGRNIANTLSEFFQQGVKDKDVMTFTYQLGVLLDAGFPLDRALSILYELTDKKAFRDMIKDILSQIRSGKSFSGRSLNSNQHSRYFM